ncbi:MAG: DUF2848 domain-containing protein [Minwuia sp.]|uniref:DUF2848 domain-containing protein n=1 Tax=Minwuia sp. TaxID=2493630 RepID=UPI003A835843
MKELTFGVEPVDGAPSTIEAQLNGLVMAGWTGRDEAALWHHIEELKELGVKPPASVPVFYPLSPDRVTLGDLIHVSGEGNSGEVEYFLLKHRGETFVGCGSDHTDRDLESVSVTLSKQICDKPVAGTLWRYEDVAPHWDRLQLSAWCDFGNGEELYQQSTLDQMREPADLLARGYANGELTEGGVMFGGAPGAIGGIRPAASFRMELHDPVLGRSLGHAYRIETLAMPG